MKDESLNSLTRERDGEAEENTTPKDEGLEDAEEYGECNEAGNMGKPF